MASADADSTSVDKGDCLLVSLDTTGDFDLNLATSSSFDNLNVFDARTAWAHTGSCFNEVGAGI